MASHTTFVTMAFECFQDRAVAHVIARAHLVREPVWQPETLAQAGVLLTIGYNGKLSIERGLVKPEDKKAVAASRKADASGESVEQPVSAYSSALVEDLTPQRTARFTRHVERQCTDAAEKKLSGSGWLPTSLRAAA